jgi:hypothetical protein
VSRIRGGGWRRGTTYAAVTALATCLWVAPAAPAAAAFLAPTAVGVGAFDDARVWEAVGTAAGSVVRARNYRVGLPGATVDAQRWQWERVASSASAGITFRIRNVASSRCLDRTSAGVVINDCGNGATQRWRAPLDDPYGGWTLVNVGNSQCLASRADPNSGALVQTNVCDGGALQRWRMRPAPQDCTIRNREWVQTDVCASQSSDRMRGVTSNWRHYPLSMAWRDPNDFALSNTVKNFVQAQPLKPDLSQGQTGVEFGTRADRSNQASGTVSYSAYWLEWNAANEQYHGLDAAQAPRSETADGRNHTFMLLGNGDAAQWDLLYDYNTVARTTLQAGGSTRLSRTGTAVRYPEAVTAGQAFGFRMQLMNGNEEWRLPYLSETGLGEPKKCDTPPRYEDWIYDVVNLPPNCFTSSYKALPGTTATDPVVLDSFGVGKPATALAAATKPAPRAAPSAVANVHNGVDQQALAACLDNDASNCLTHVPGLAACVASRQVCNLTGRGGQTAKSPAGITAAQALAHAQRNFSTLSGSSKVGVVTNLTVDTRLTGGYVADGPVHVVRSTARVKSMAASNPKVYDGYMAVFEARSGQMIYACMGTRCGDVS